MQLTRVTSNPCIRQTSKTAQNSQTSVDNNHQFPDFKTFLEKSPYAQIKLRKTRNREHSLDERIENERIFNKDLSLQAPTSDLKRNERGFLLAPDQPSVHFDVGNDISPVRILDHSQTYQEFPTICHPHQIDFNHSRNLSAVTDCLSPSNQDRKSARPQETANEKAMKKLLENMQEQMRKMDVENRKLKKENATLTSQNKKFQIQVASFIVEQENFVKAKTDYEKRLKRLEDYYKSSDEMNATLQQILSLQEDEYYDRVVNKKESILKINSTQNTAGFDPKKLVRKQTKQVSIMKSTTMLDSTQNTTAFDRSRSRTNLTEKSNTMIFRKHTLTASINDIVTPQRISRPMTAKAKDGASIHFDFKQALEKYQ